MMKPAMTAFLTLAIQAATMSGDRGRVIAADELRSNFTPLIAQAKVSGSSGSTLTGYGNLTLKLSVRTASGGAEIHANYDDLMIVEQGAATLVTGGTVLNGKTDSNGETLGSGIQNGHTETLVPGDLAIVPAGVPHQLLLAPGTTYAAVVAKVKE